MLAVAEGGTQQEDPLPAAVLNGAKASQSGAARPVAATARRRSPGEAEWWLRGAAAVLALLATSAAAVSWQAQYVMVLGVKHAQVVATIEAGIPDAGALIFAALGVALALHGRRALRPRVLNAACIGISLAMNALAAGRGWRDLAIWIMPAAIYALASDTLIGVVRARALARQRADRAGLGDDTPDLLAGLAGTALWLLRLLLAGPSTLQGFRAWVIAECPVAPGRKATPAAALPATVTMPALTRRPARNPYKPGHDGRPTKRDILISLARERRDLATVPLREVSKLATALAQEIGYSPGTARRELIRHVRDLQSSSAETTPAVRQENADA